MTIFLCSENQILTKILADELEKKDYNCVTFYSLDSLIANLNNFSNTNVTLNPNIDLIIFDYTLWNHEYYSFFEAEQQTNTYIPYIFFNDPCFILNDRKATWKQLLRLFMYKLPDVIKIENRKEFMGKYNDIFTLLQQLVESEALYDYIPLMQKELPFPDHLPIKDSFNYLENHKTYSRLSYRNYPEINYLPERLQYLFRIFYKNINIPISLDEILKKYQNDYRKMTKESLTVLISNLKKELQMDKNTHYEILSNGKLYILIFYPLTIES